MAFGFSLSGSSSSSKNHSWIDPKTSAAQWGNYESAQGINPTYSPTSGGLIGQYLNPYTDEVVNKSLDALERSRMMAVNHTADAATAAHAFGGSRHGVAEALTNGEYGQQAGLLSSQLYNQGFGQALDAAQQENQMAYAYPLQRQGLLNQTLGQITPETFSKGKNSSFGGSAGVSFGK